MRNTLDLSPLHRFAVGFDRVQNLIDSASQWDAQDQAYPPYNVEKHGDDAFRITVAVAGFTRDELDIVVKENSLTITGKQNQAADDVTYLHRGIAGRAFERRFQLAEYIEVESASVENGLLHVNLVRRVPEEKQPKTIQIGTGGDQKVIGQKPN